ncbi:MAG: hypothetical protein ACI915_002185 [Gammaproteobacteria bacterium]|jgi:hypothetical protein
MTPRDQTPSPSKLYAIHEPFLVNIRAKNVFMGLAVGENFVKNIGRMNISLGIELTF